MWISEKYCKNWGLKEAIREFIQNQYDGVITKIESKKNLKIVKIGKKYTINERKKNLEFNLMKIGDHFLIIIEFIIIINIIYIINKINYIFYFFKC